MSTPTESQEQITLMAWCRMNKGQYPGLDLIHHIPNGGHRNKLVAEKLKKEGVKAGVPDLFLPVPTAGHHGLYIELKRKTGGVASAVQKKWIESLKNQGYAVEVCAGWESARDVIICYYENLSKKNTDR